MKYNYLNSDDDPNPDTYSISILNYPNPFNDRTNFRYRLQENSDVSIIIYNLKGSIVKNLVNEYQTKGPRIVSWNATTENSGPISAGVYLYQIKAGKNTVTKKTIYLK